jgi:outer membrane protein TolC
MRASLILALVLTRSAWAADLSILDRFAEEPSVRELQREAARVAESQPERVRSWLRRVGTSGLLPTLRVRVGRGLSELTRDAYGRPVLTNTDTWHFDVEATWALDRLVFDRNELRASREAQRVASRREELLVRVAQLYFERRRLQVDALLTPDSPSAIDRGIEIEELTAILDGLSDGALSRGKRRP